MLREDSSHLQILKKGVTHEKVQYSRSGNTQDYRRSLSEGLRQTAIVRLQ